MRVLGVTGGTGCGKTVVCRILKEQGGKIIDADKITRKLQDIHRPLGQGRCDESQYCQWACRSLSNTRHRFRAWTAPCE